MLGKILCGLGLHSWRLSERWLPDFHAPIVTRVETRSVCDRCGKVDEYISTFDEATGQPLKNTHNGVAI
jgi:hypothetical protein